LLKRDVFSTVERGRFRDEAGEVDAVLRRLDQVPVWSYPLARHLFTRERRALSRLDELQRNWTEKAELALSKDREDLAKAALVERQKAADMADGLREEIKVIDDTLKGYEGDIAKLQGKLREARARQNAIAARFESAVTRARAREIMNGSRTEDAFSRFEVLERRADFAEGRADALGMTGPKSLEEEIAELKANESVDAELEAMKAALKARGK